MKLKKLSYFMFAGLERTRSREGRDGFSSMLPVVNVVRRWLSCPKQQLERAGQCVTSADCASRVPYCSALGFCHGGRLPFDEQQLQIEEGVFAAQPEEQPQGRRERDANRTN